MEKFSPCPKCGSAEIERVLEAREWVYCGKCNWQEPSMWWNRRFEKGFCPDDTNVFEERLEVLQKYEKQVVEITVKRCLDIIRTEKIKLDEGSNLQNYLEFAEGILTEHLMVLIKQGLHLMEYHLSDKKK